MGTNYTLTATVTSGGSAVSGATVTFNVISGPNAGKTATGVTDLSGHATFTYSSTVPGTDTVRASFVDSTGATQTSNTATVTWTGAATALAFTSGPTTGDFNDPVTVSAILTNKSTGAPIANEPIVFQLDSQAPCTGTTNAAGIASCTITPNEPAGSYTLKANFAGDTAQGFLASSATTMFTVTLEETKLTSRRSVGVACEFKLAISGSRRLEAARVA